MAPHSSSTRTSRVTLDGYSTVTSSRGGGGGPQPDYWATLDSNLTYKSYGDYSEIVYTPPNMCYVIITIRSLLWTLLTVVSTVAVVGALISPYWLVGRARWVANPPGSNRSVFDFADRTYNPSLGIFNKCIKVLTAAGPRHTCDSFVTGFEQHNDEFPNLWKSALILFMLAVALLGFTNITAVFSLCIQAIFRKSIFTVSGLLQAIAGLLLIVAEMLYPAGWSSARVREVCGERTGPYLINDCSLGWSFYVLLGGTLLVLLSAALSMQAETATSSDRVEKHVMDGKTLICIAS